MKIAILGDTHFGMRGDSLHFHAFYRNFYKNTFFPYLEENNIDTVIQLGDLFDRRKFVSFQTLYLAREYFFDVIENKKMNFYTLLGNHDIAYKNTLEVNSPQLLLRDYNHIHVIDSPYEFCGIDIIPWICKENEVEVSEYIKNSKNHICFGHFEITGFEMDKGLVCHDGMDRSVLSKYEMVLSGHFHHRSSDGQITYVGTPGEMTWSDYGDKRGFHIFDTETRDLDFIENPYKIFHKIIYDDRQETLESVQEKDYNIYKNTIVKVIVANKSNPVLYDMFLDNLYKATPMDLSIVEDFTDYTEVSDEDIVDQSDDTITILDKCIDGMELDINKDKLKNIMREFYMQAQKLETA